jgi:hypothetical protein
MEDPMETYDIIEMQDAYVGFHPAFFRLEPTDRHDISFDFRGSLFCSHNCTTAQELGRELSSSSRAGEAMNIYDRRVLDNHDGPELS